MKTASAFLILASLAVVAGCGSDFRMAPGLDGGSRADGGGIVDGGTPADGGFPQDGGPDGGSDGGLLDGGPGPDGGLDGGQDGGADGGIPAGQCPVTLTYAAASSITSVHVAGEWNAFSPTAQPMTKDDQGNYRALFSLAPGVYGYKLVAQGDTSDPWRLDPGNPYRIYVSTVENSGLRVPDCFRPELVVETAGGSRPAQGQGRIDARLRYEARRAGSLLSVSGELKTGRAARALTSGELSVSGGVVTVAVAGLADGKHTVRLVATDNGARESEAVLLPVWIEPEPFDWKGALIYMVFTDRFRDGDPTNNRSSAGSQPSADWKGGDLQGVTAALRDGYFDALGVRALWLTPFNKNPDGSYLADDNVHMVSGYHGYWPIDPLAVDSRLGGDAALQEMVETAHARGIRVLMDLALNQVHELHPYVTSHPEWFNTGCICGTAGCDWTAHRLDCMFRPYTPDINWQNKVANEQFLADAEGWMERFDLDGFRVDAVKHVHDSAVFNLGTRVREKFEGGGAKLFLLGETAMGWCADQAPTSTCNADQYGTISRYIGPYGLSGQFDFVLYYAASVQFLQDTAQRGMLHIDYWTRMSQEHYPPGAVMTPYIGSHDSSRFISLQAHPSQAGNKWDNLPPQPTTDEPYDRMYVAFAWLLAIPGAPLVFQGDEYGEFGGADPDNRHVMRFGGGLSSREALQIARVRKLGKARAELRGLRSAAYRSLLVTETFWSVARGTGDDLVIAAINRAAQAAMVSIPIPAEVAASGRSFTDALGSGITASVNSGTLGLTLPARSAAYLH
jgi:glycosidase